MSPEVVVDVRAGGPYLVGTGIASVSGLSGFQNTKTNEKAAFVALVSW